jgi:hypothetical protein
MLALIYLLYDESGVDCGDCAGFAFEANCTFHSIGGYPGLGNSCEWSAATGHCRMRGVSHSVWSVCVAAVVTSVLGTPIAAVVRWTVREFVFAATKRYEVNSMAEHEGFLWCIPPAIIEWIIAKQYTSLKDSFDLLKSYGLSTQLLTALKNTESDVIFLKAKIYEHAQSLSDDRRVDFLVSWGLTPVDDCSIPHTSSEAPEVGNPAPSASEQNISAMQDDDDVGLFKRRWRFDYLVEQLLRVNMCALKERQVILQRLQFTSEPLCEVRVIKLLIDDLLSDGEISILQVKRKSDDRFDISTVPAKSIASKVFVGIFLMWYLWGCGYLAFYYGSTRCEGMQVLYASSFLVWLVMDATIIQTFVVYLKEFFIPTLISNKIMNVQALIVRCICELDKFTSSEKKFKWSLMLYASARVTSKYFGSRLGELMLSLALEVPRRSEMISSYSNKAVLKLNVHNCVDANLTSKNNQNWEISRTAALKVCEILLSVPFSSVFVIEWISNCIICLFLVGSFYVYLNFGLSVMLMFVVGFPVLMGFSHILYLCQSPHRRVRSKWDRNDENIQQLGRKPYIPRKKRSRQNGNSCKSDSDGSIIFHESVVCDDFSFDVDQNKTEFFKLLDETSLFSGKDDSKLPKVFQDQSSLFDNLYNSEIRAMIDNDSLFSSELKAKEFEDSLFDFSSNQNGDGKGKLRDVLDKSLVSGVTWEQGQSLEDSFGTYNKPRGLFDSSLLKPTLYDDDCSLFSDPKASAISMLKDQQGKNNAISTHNSVAICEMLQDSDSDEVASPNKNDNFNIFDKVSTTGDISEVVVPPQLLSFLEGKSDDEKLKIFFSLADDTAKAHMKERGDPSLIVQRYETSTKDQLLQAVFKKNLKPLKKEMPLNFENEASGGETGIPATLSACNLGDITPNKDNMLIYRSGNASYSGNVADNKKLFAPTSLETCQANGESQNTRLELGPSLDDSDFAAKMEQFSSFMQTIDKGPPEKKL